MYCENCGNELREGAQFCTHCGETVKSAEPTISDNQVWQNQQTEATSATYYETEGSAAPETEVSIKKKKAKKPLKTRIIAIVAAVAFIAGSGLFVWLNPYANNAFMKLILNSEDYTRYVIGKNLKNLSGNLTDEKIKMIASSALNRGMVMIGPYDQSNSVSMSQIAMSAAVADGSTEVSAEINMIPEIENLIEDNMDYDADMFTWVDNAKVTYSIDSSRDKFGMGAKAVINNIDICSADAAIDIEKGDVYLSSPELLGNPAKVNFVDPAETEYDERMEHYNKIIETVPNAEVTEKILTRYITCILEQIDDVEEESEALEVRDVSQRCTKLTFNIDDKMCKDVAQAVLKEAKNDSEMKGIIKDVAKAMNEDSDAVIKEFESAIQSELDNIKTWETSGEDFVEITLWVNARGEITGIDIIPDEGLGEDVSISVYDVKKGRKCASSAEVFVDGQKVTLSGDGEIKRNKRSMDLTLKMMGADIVDFSLSNVDEKSLKKGLFDGKLEIMLNDDLKPMLGMYMDSEYSSLLFDAKIVMESEMESANKGKGTFTLLLENKQVIKLSVDSQIGNGNVKLPIDAKEYEDISDIENKINTSLVLDALEKAGAPSEITDALE